MNLNQLYYFMEVAQNLNFRKASEILHIAQPSLSYSISKLEEELGVKLFDRNKNKISLTKPGEIYLSQIDSILKRLEGTNKYIKKMADPESGHLDLAYTYSLPKWFVPENVRQFISINNGITFSFNQAPTKYLINALKEKTYDVVFCTQMEQDPEISFTPIWSQEVVVIAPYNHPLSHRKEIALAELKDFDYIMYAKGSGIYKFINDLFEENNFTPNIKYECSGETSIAALVSRGFGVACVARVEELEYEPVVQIKLSPAPFRNICMAYMKNSYQIPTVMKFIDFIKSKWSIRQ